MHKINSNSFVVASAEAGSSPRLILDFFVNGRFDRRCHFWLAVPLCLTEVMKLERRLVRR